MAFERDYKSYPDYETTTHHEHREPSYYNPTSPSYLNYVRNMGTMTPARKPPQMGVSASHHHRRTLSNISSNISGYATVEMDENKPNYQYGRINQMPNRMTSTSPINYTNRMRSYENVPFNRSHDVAPNYLNTSTTANEYASTQFERPDSLPFEIGANTKLRSSLRKYSNASPRFGTSSLTMQQQQQSIPHKSSPTKTTPSDSLSDDSSYLSAREGSISSQSRVRFSPETLHDQQVSNTTSVTTPLRRLSRSQRHSISDMLAPSTS